MVKDWKVLLKAVRRLLVRRGRSAEDADDLMQEAWLRFAVIEAREQVGCPQALLTRVALNLAVSADRARASRGEVLALDDVCLLDTAPSVEATVLARERMAHLELCLGRLGRKTCAVFVDVRVGGMSFAEAARVHHISVRSVEKHVSVATERIFQWSEGWRQ